MQETWLGVLRGLEEFQERSSLKTWIFRILVNRAKTHAVREGRSIPFSSLPGPAADSAELAVDPDRFVPPGHLWSGHWASPLHAWDKTPEELALSRETHALIEEAVASLPLRQREVIALRDIEGWTSEEVCNLLGINETNQRVLLHRARSKVRRTIERYLDEGGGSGMITFGGLTCKELVDLVTDYLEGKLPPPDRVRFEKHLALCPNCPTYLEQMRQTIRALGMLPEESIAPEARQELLAIFRNWRRG